MNKLDKLFNEKNRNLLSIFYTAGFPRLKDTSIILRSLEKYGADLVEVGIPFSDPVADGPVIQKSNSISLKNGMSLQTLFSQLEEVENDCSLPIILMGYFNQLLQFGVEKFCQACNASSVDGVIIPDLPLSEYQRKYKTFFKRYNLHLIFLVSPQTTEERLKEIANETDSFIYAVSVNATTGGSSNLAEQQDYFRRVTSITNKLVIIGFGVRDRESFLKACEYSGGAIIGSAFIDALGGAGNIDGKVKKFVKSIID